MLLNYDFGNVTELYSTGTPALSCSADNIGTLPRICRTGQYDGVSVNKRVCNIIESTMHLFILYRVMSLLLLNRGVS